MTRRGLPSYADCMIESVNAVAEAMSGLGTVPVRWTRVRGEVRFFLARRETWSWLSLSTPAHRTLRRRVRTTGHFSGED